MRATVWLIVFISASLSAAEQQTQSGSSDQKSVSAPIAQFRSKSADDWARQLPDFLPAIEKCVADAGVRTAFVVKAWAMTHGTVGVRLQGRDRQYICIAARSGMWLGSVQPVSIYETPMAGNPVFYPAPEQPLKIECGRLERVVTREKLFAGWLQYDPCPLEMPPARQGTLRSGFGANL